MASLLTNVGPMVVTTYQEETREVLEDFWHTSLAKNTAEVSPAICIGGAFLRSHKDIS